MAGTPIVFDILANDRASSKFAALGRSVDGSTSHLSKFRSVASAAAKASLLVGVAATGIAFKLGVDAVKAASDLSETLNKSRVIFGKHADGMEAWAGRADQSMGLSKQAALEAAASFGDMFGQIGFSGNQATAMSRSVVQLSADLGSFNNLDTADVAERMSAAFRGEYDSLQALIPNINAARVEQVALAKTGKTATAELTAQEKAAAVLAIVHKDGARAVGDFARTSDGLANRTKILKAELSNLQAEIGAKLLPVVTDVAGAFLDKGVPALEKFGDKAGPVFDSMIDGAGDLWDAVRPAVDEIVEAFGHLVDEGGGAGDMFEDKLVPAVSTFADLVGGLVNFVDNLPGPIKNMGIEAGIAAVAFSYLAPGIDKAKGAMSGLLGPTATATTRMKALSKAASTAAGIGGLALLVDGATRSNEALGILESTLGGGLLGAAVGGPIGAVAGAAGGLAVAIQGLNDDVEDGTGRWQDYADTLDEVSAAMGEQTRQMAYQSLLEQGLLDAAGQLGISQQTLLNGVLGQEDARQKLARALREEEAAISESTGAVKLSREEYDKLSEAEKDELAAQGESLESRRAAIDAIREEIGAVRKSVREKIHEIAVVKKIPRRVVTEFLNKGVTKNLADVRRLARTYELTPKQVRTIVKATGVDVSRKELDGLIAKLRAADKDKSTPQFDADPRPFKDKHAKLMASLRELDREVAQPKSDLTLDEYYRKRAQLIASLNSIPDETVNIWTVRHDGGGGGGGGGGGNRGGDLTVPRFTVDPRLGIDPRMTLRGGGSNPFHGIAAGIIRAFTQGINGNASEAEHAVERMMAAIKKALGDKKISEAAAKRMREAVQAMAREADKGRAVLAKRADFASTLRESFASELNLGELVSSETFGGIGDLTGGAQSLANRLRAFAGQLSELRQAGIPRSLIGEIASLGSDQGSKAAAAILSGSASEQNALSSAYNQLQSAAGLAGNSAANAVHGSVRQIKNEFHINVHAGLGANGREIGREIEQALTKWQREQNRPLNFTSS